MEQIAARKAAQEAAEAAANGTPEAEPGVFTEPTAEEKAAALAAAAPEPEVKQPGPPGSYRSVRLERFFKASGMRVEPNADGFFIPADAEEASILAHYAVNGYELVEYQDEVPAA